MKILYYDIESSTGYYGDICEFGYLITNERFEILNKENIYIDPNAKFVKRIQKEILSKEESFYYSQFNFYHFYNKIKKLFDETDIVIGYSTVNDADFLNHECFNYDLPFINYQFYDVQKIISEYYGIDKCYSLEKSIELLNIKNDGEFHNAMSDAYHTMLLFEKICNNLNFSINETLSLFNNTVDKTTNGIVESVMINHLIKEEKYRFLINECKNNKISWEAKTILLRYMEKVNINKSIKHKFKNQKICFSKEIIKNHCYEMFNIIHNLSFRGIKIVKNKDKCNYYICDKNSAKNTISLLENTSDNHKIIVITFEELLNELKITRDELINKEFPSLNCITNINPYEYRKKGCKINKSIREKERKEFMTYFGELFNKYKSEGKLCYN